jgi:hypothetical protein
VTRVQPATRRSSLPRQPPIAHRMEISGAAAMQIQANALDSVRSTLASARAQPGTSQAQAAVILSLSAAASALLVGHPK